MPFALRNLVRRPLRSALTLLGIALGTATYLVLASSAAGIEEETSKIVASLRTDLIVQRAGMPFPWQSRIAPAEVELLRGLPGVAVASPLVVGVTKIETRPRFFVFGLEPARLESLGLTFLSGRAFSAGTDELLAGVDAARELDLGPGDRAAIVGRREFTVVGVYRTGRQLFDGGVLLDIPAAQEVFRQGDVVNLVLVGLAPAARSDSVAAEVAARIPGLEAVPADLFASQQRWLGDFARFGRALALLAVVIAALGVSNTLSMNVAERTGELGLLRALGWRRARIARLVLAEGVALSTGGLLLGIPLASVVLRALVSGDYLGIVPGRLPVATALEGLAAVLAAGLLASVPPLVHALEISPALALREL